MSYSDLLKDRRWQRRRLEVFELAGWICQSCGNSDNDVQLHVHHKRYYRGRKPWEYEPHELEALCEHCHTATHKKVSDENPNLYGMSDAELVEAAHTLRDKTVYRFKVFFTDGSFEWMCDPSRAQREQCERAEAKIIEIGLILESRGREPVGV